MTKTRTDKQTLLEKIIPDAQQRAVTARAAGTSWQGIADTLSTEAGITVSREAVRRWYGPAFDAEQARRWGNA